MSDSPGRFQNVKDAELKVGAAIDDVDIVKFIGNQRHEFELLTDSAAGENQIVHGHGHGDVTGSSEDGFTKRDGGFSCTFRSGTSTDAQWTLANTNWTDTGLTIRCNPGPFRRVATEMYYKVSGNGVRFRVERWDWNDSSADTDDGGTFGTNALQEQTYSRATSLAWHTVDGQKWDASATTFSGSDTKLLVLSGPTSLTTLHEVNDDCGFHLWAQASTANTTLHIGALRILPAKTTDEGTGEKFS